MRKNLIITLGFVCTLFACHSSKKVVNEPDPPMPPDHPIDTEVRLNDQIKKGKIDLVIYEHDDGSLPPEHKRDYSIRIYRDSIRVNIWGHTWSNINFKRTYPSTPDVLKAFLDDLKKLDIRKQNIPEIQAPGAGGTSGSLRAYAGEECVFGAGAYFCQGVFGDLHMNDNYESAVESLFQKRVPESMESLFHEALPYQYSTP